MLRTTNERFGSDPLIHDAGSEVRDSELNIVSIQSLLDTESLEESTSLFACMDLLQLVVCVEWRIGGKAGAQIQISRNTQLSSLSNITVTQDRISHIRGAFKHEVDWESNF